MPARTIHLTAEHDGLSLGQALKRLVADKPWSQVRRLIAGRQVQVNGNLCLDEGRRVKAGDVLKLWDHPLARPADASDVKIVHLDEHLVVVNKPAGVTTLRHREETDLPQRRKQLQPTLDELVAELLTALGSPKRKRGSSGIRPVHRLDRDTSGLMVFARTPEAERRLIRMFSKHAVTRAYVAVVHGRVEAQTIDTWLVRDRGDGLRGSLPLPLPLGEGRGVGAQRAITHLRPLEHLPDYTILECRLETGRTHQIRIHLSEIGHRLCGEKTYTHSLGGRPQDDASRAPRQALHAAELAFAHPITGQLLRFRAPLPRDLKEWLLKLKAK
jgi:23S rRNA pseudouridine1911/1915/1917 synthase